MSGAWLCSPGRIFTLRNQLCTYNVIMTHWGNQILQYAKIFFMGSITQQKTSFSKFSVIHQSIFVIFAAFSALTLLVGRQEGHPACKKTEWWGTGVVICLEQGAHLHMAQLMPLPLTVSCSSKIQIGFTFLVPAYSGCPGKEAVKWLYFCNFASTGP